MTRRQNSLLRKLDQDEREWCGALAIMTLIMGLSLNTVLDLTKEPMNIWEKEIMAQEKPNPIQTGIFLIAYLSRILWVVIAIQPLFSFMNRLGFVDKMPERWIKYLGTKNRRTR